MAKAQGKIFDVQLFYKIMGFSKPYRGYYYLVLYSAIALSVFSTLSPYLLKVAVDEYITPRDYQGLLLFISLMLGVLILEVVFQYIFIYYANSLGQFIVKDLRVKLFDKILHFKRTNIICNSCI